jgi:PAS domain S-box-containing protein
MPKNFEDENIELKTKIADLEQLVESLQNQIKISETYNVKSEIGVSEAALRLKMLSEASFEAIFISEKGYCIDTNITGCKMFGYEYSEILGMFANDIFAGESKELVKQNILSGVLFSYEAVGIRKNGEKFDVEIQGKNYLYDGRNVRVTAIRDISVKKIAEREKEQISIKFQTVFENAGDGILIGDNNGVIVDLNQSFCDFSKYSKDQILNKHISILFPKGVLAEKPLKFAELDHGKSVILQRQIVGAEGDLIPIEMNSRRLDKSHYISVVRDLSERKKAEEARIEADDKYKAAFLTSPDSININTMNGDFADINQGFTKMCGFSREEVIGKKSEEITIWKNPHEREYILQYVDKHDYIENFETVFKHKNGDLKTVLLSARVVKINNIPHILSTARDISERKKTETLIRKQNEKLELVNNELSALNEEYLAQNEELESAEKETREANEKLKITGDYIKKIKAELIVSKEKAEESDRLKTAFLANMSHEIRTPMNGIIGFSEMLKNDDLVPQKRDIYINTINDCGFQLLRIVNDVIDISKIETNQIDLFETDTDVREMLTAISEYYRENKKNPEIEIRLNIHEIKNGNSIKTDSDKFRQIIDNLMSNAVKFTKKGFVELGGLTENNFLKIYVKDTGIGIPKHLNESVFERFRQVETNYSKIAGGTGLGLAISKAFAEKLGGKIWVESDINQGSVFYFTLPLQYHEMSETAIKTNESDKKDNEKVFLIVEDEITNYILIQEYVSKISKNILYASTGMQAMELFEKHTEIDLVLMDLKLPDIDGFEITKKMKSIRSEIPIIAQTAYAFSTDKQKALAAGCDDYISKPIEPNLLLKLIRKYLR